MLHQQCIVNIGNCDLTVHVLIKLILATRDCDSIKCVCVGGGSINSINLQETVNPTGYKIHKNWYNAQNNYRCRYVTT